MSTWNETGAEAGIQPAAAETAVRILFLEDRAEDVLLCRRALETSGFHLSVEVAATVEELMARVRAAPYDIIIADYNLGVGSKTGLDALAELKAENWDIPFFLVTGALGEERAVACLREGATDYIPKHRMASLPASVRRALAEKRLRQEKKQFSEDLSRLAAIVESSYDAIVSSDLQGGITTWNTAAEKMYGYAASEALGQAMSLIIPPDRLHEMPVLEGKPERRQSVRQKETVRKTRDGRLIPVLVTVSPLRGVDGGIAGTSEIAHDITERARMEAQLRHSNWQLEEQNRIIRESDRMKSLFVANMSHEVRTPLNCMIGFAEVLYDGKLGPLTEAHHECMGDILTAARHLGQLVNDSLDLAKIESGKIEFRPAPVELHTLVGEVAHLLTPLADSKSIQIDQAVSDLGVVTVDAGRVKQILHNFISNALKFSPDGGRVAVNVRPEGPSQFRIEVEDSGIGIKPDDIGRLFQEFQQLDSGTGKMYQGTGLGLALTRRLAEAQGGAVGVRSTHGKGSVFHAILPRVFQETPAGDDHTAPRLLVVANDTQGADLLTQMLVSNELEGKSR